MARRLNIVFWNVRNLFEPNIVPRGPASQAELNTKLDVIARVLRRIGPPDVLVLAEVATRRLAEELAKRVYGPQGGWQLIFEVAKDPGFTGIAILGSRTVVRVDALDVDRGTGSGRPRAVWAEVELVGKAERLFLAACHWKSDLQRGQISPEDDRTKSGRWLDAKVTAVGRAAPVIAIGDFNAEPFAPELTRGLRSCRHYSTTVNGRLFAALWPWLAEPDDYSATKRNGYKVSRPRGTFSGSPPRILDQVLVSRALLEGAPFGLVQSSLRVHVDADTCVERRTGHVEPRTQTSDHFPLVVELRY